MEQIITRLQKSYDKNCANLVDVKKKYEIINNNIETTDKIFITYNPKDIFILCKNTTELFNQLSSSDNLKYLA